MSFYTLLESLFPLKANADKIWVLLLVNQNKHRVCRVNKFLSRADLSPNEWNELNFCSCVAICFQFTSVKEMFSWHLLSKG